MDSQVGPENIMAKTGRMDSPNLSSSVSAGLQWLKNVPASSYYKVGKFQYLAYFRVFRLLWQSSVGLDDKAWMLDAGCGGTGTILELPDYVSSVGMDMDREGLAKSRRESHAKKLYKSSLVRATIKSVPFREEVFDLIVCRDVLEHVEEKSRAVDEMDLCLRHGGSLLISTSNLISPRNFLDPLIPERFVKRPVRKLGLEIGMHFERTGRFNPWSLAYALWSRGLVITQFLILGELFAYQKSWTTHPPRFVYLWAILNKISNRMPLLFFKDNILVLSRKS